jgi:hypothetical protein
LAAFSAVPETRLLCRDGTHQLQVNGDRHIITNHSSATVHTEVLQITSVVTDVPNVKIASRLFNRSAGCINRQLKFIMSW